jgi:hypothetical protein
VKRFEIGDIVFVKSYSPLYPSLKRVTNFGIIKGEARLLYVHDWETEEVRKEFWAYDILIEGQVFENVPEEGLRKIDEEELRNENQ